MPAKARPFTALAAGLVLLATACGADDDRPAASGPGVTASSTTTTHSASGRPSLTITSPASGTTVEGNVVPLDLEAEGFSLVKADGDTSGESGHFHVFVDADPVAVGETIPRGPGIIHSAEERITLYGMSTGPHRLAVVFGDGTHRRIHGDVEEGLTLTVAGPSVDASAPATVAAGQPVNVDVAVDGISLVKADGDTSGTTGHLHLFVDREPTPAGQPIPAEEGVIHTAEPSVAVSDLPAGEHTIWVVVGDGAHVPLEPLVADRLTVTVQ
jgi:hypothetical protein